MSLCPGVRAEPGPPWHPRPGIQHLLTLSTAGVRAVGAAVPLGGIPWDGEGVTPSSSEAAWPWEWLFKLLQSPFTLQDGSMALACSQGSGLWVLLRSSGGFHGMQRGLPTAPQRQTGPGSGYLNSPKARVHFRRMGPLPWHAWGRVLGLHLCPVPKIQSWLWSSSLPRL